MHIDLDGAPRNNNFLVSCELDHARRESRRRGRQPTNDHDRWRAVHSVLGHGAGVHRRQENDEDKETYRVARRLPRSRSRPRECRGGTWRPPSHATDLPVRAHIRIDRTCLFPRAGTCTAAPRSRCTHADHISASDAEAAQRLALTGECGRDATAACAEAAAEPCRERSELLEHCQLCGQLKEAKVREHGAKREQSDASASRA